MSTELTKAEPRSVLNDMSKRFNMEPGPFEATVRATCMRPDKHGNVPNNAEFAAFLLVAKTYELNPLLKEIYAFPAKGGGIVPVVSIDGWVNLINSSPQLDGFDFEFKDNEKGELVSCTCTMYRKDRSKPVVVTEFLNECIRNTEPWAMKRRMLRHKTLIQTARYAFGFGGIYDDDEARKIADMVDVTPSDEEPPVPPAKTAAAKDEKPKAVPRAVEGEVIPPKPKTEPKAEPKAQAEVEHDPETGEIDDSAGQPEDNQDPFERYLAGFDAAMAAVDTLDALKPIWMDRDKSWPEDSQTAAMVAVRDKHKARVEAAKAKPKDEPAPKVTEKPAGGEDEFSEFDFRQTFPERLAAVAKDEAKLLELKEEIDEHMEAGRITAKRFSDHYEDPLTEAIERL